MKKASLALLVAGAMTIAGARIVTAHEEHEMGEHHMMMDTGKRADHLATMLDLTPDQKTQVKSLLDAKEARVKPAREAFEKEMKAAHEEFDTNVRKILNDKQAKKWDAMEEREEHEHHARHMDKASKTDKTAK